MTWITRHPYALERGRTCPMRYQDETGRWWHYVGGLKDGAPTYREERRAMTYATEAQEQAALIAWADLLTPQEPRLALLFHPANGGKRDKATAGKLKAQGVRAGCPDLWLPVAARGFHGLVIELKAAHGRTSPEQLTWIERLMAGGYFAGVHHGWVDAAATICWYLDREDLPVPEATQ